MAKITGVYTASHTPVMLNFPDRIPAALKDEIFGAYRAMGEDFMRGRRYLPDRRPLKYPKGAVPMMPWSRQLPVLGQHQMRHEWRRCRSRQRFSLARSSASLVSVRGTGVISASPTV
jgi:hypothetical protein